MWLYLKFIGQDGSMGFRHDHYYEVKVYSANRFIWIETRDGVKCPYVTAAALAHNWR
jgi:hypothetical protein